MKHDPGKSTPPPTVTVTLPPDQPATADGSKPGGWWHADPAEAGRIVCDLCPRECVLRPGDRGFCFVRENRDGQMLLTTYGRSTGFCIDPIEKKPLNHFYPGTSVLSFGTAGCNLACKFCQNWSISKSREVQRLSELAMPDAIARAAHELECQSVAYTYNDPIIWAEYAIDVARVCREHDVRNVAVTAGYITPAAREPFFRYMDAANVDLKGFTDEFYQKLTLSHLQPVLDTLQWLVQETDVWVEVTNLVIPHANDDEAELRKMCDWLVDTLGPHVPMHFTAFHPDFRLRDREATPTETLLRAHELAIQSGMQYVYVGNVHDETHQSTYCPACGACVLQRDWYELGTYRLQENRCAACGHTIHGRFASRPGNWGHRRVPVDMRRFADVVPLEPTLLRSAPQTPTDDSMPRPSPAPESSDAIASLQELSPRQRQLIHETSAQMVAAAVIGQSATASELSLDPAGQLPVMGCFVTLKRDDHLRACCGSLGKSFRLQEALLQASTTTATRDARLPLISACELSHLQLSVSLLHGMQRVDVPANERWKAVEIGRDGLQIQLGQARGLLLPDVATEHGMDARTFLQQVCVKAGLPPTAWKDPRATLFTFQSCVISGPFPPSIGDPIARLSHFEISDEELARLTEFCRQNAHAIGLGALPGYYLRDCPDGMVSGLAVTLSSGHDAQRFQVGKLSTRPGIPLQATLSELTKNAADVLDGRIPPEHRSQVRFDLAVLRDPALHGTLADHDLAGLDVATRCVLVTEGQKSAWVFDPHASPEQVVQAASEAAQVRMPESASVVSLRINSTQVPERFTSLPAAHRGAAHRPPAVAGSFYSSEPAELARSVQSLFAASQAKDMASWPAAMLPHAGLKYSGRIAAAVLARIEIPDTVIVLGPKHTGLGVNCAVAPHDTWDLPGMTLQNDLPLARRLAQVIPELEMDSAAHAREHAVEVELPLLAHVAPQTKVVGIVLGREDLDGCMEFAEGLSSVLQDLPQPPLLLISSDMNHFATDEQNRLLDEMALAALESLDPERLFQVVRENHISMCGMLPAVIVMQTLRRLNRLHRAERVAYATSADVTGDSDRVVGYAGMLLG